MYKKRIGVIFGGRSEEHDVSLLSAAAVMRALDSDKFVPIYIGITRDGKWKLFEGAIEDVEGDCWQENGCDISIGSLKEKIDFALPILHGSYGEDGCVQGLLEMMDIPYGGCGVLASAVAMDKQLFKDVLASRGLPLCRSMFFGSEDMELEGKTWPGAIEKGLGLPCFVKPANMGSSVGISKVKDREQVIKALRLAGRYDRRIVVEEAIPCRELEVAVMGNDRPVASLVGEIVPSAEFYDYRAKYGMDSDTKGEAVAEKLEAGERAEKFGQSSQLKIPAPISEEDRYKITVMALEAYRAIDGAGYARVDFFKHKETGKLYINEINTIPGFTGKSMFPLLWQATGLDFCQTIERIIELGYERYYAKNNR